MYQYEEDQSLKDPTDDLKWASFNATCDCNKPDVVGKKTMINCVNCQTPAHKDCIRNRNTPHYMCATCQIDIDGLAWGAGRDALNTCPVDNTVTHLALRASKDDYFKAEIEKCCKSHSKELRAFGESVMHATKNESANSHKKWHNVLAEKDQLCNDGTWYGGTDERLYNILDEHLPQFTLNIQQPCNGQCSFTQEATNPKKLTEVPLLLTTRPIEYLLTDSPMFSPTKDACHHQGCKGETTFGPLQITSDESPLLIVVRNEGALNGPEDFQEMPKEVCISGTNYQLGMINMWDRSRGHYTSLHYIDHQFVYYDGMNKTKKKFRRAFPTDFKQETIYVDHVLYVKVCKIKL
jgi:hypothetical protein